MANFPSVANNGDPHVEGNNTWIYNDGMWVKQSPQISTDNVALFDPTNPAAVLTQQYGSARTLPSVPGDIATQYDVNRWFVDALTELDSHYDDLSGGFVAGIHVGENEPTEKENGTLWFDSSADSLTLFLYYDPDDDPSTAAWIPAAPPVSAIEEINALLSTLGDELDLVEARVYDLNTIGLQAPDPIQDGFIWKNTNPEENRAFIYNGTYPGGNWELLSHVTKISDTEPLNPVEGDLWFEPTVNKALYIYSDSQWLPAHNLKDRIETLETKVEFLEGNVLAGQWALALTGNSRPGKVMLYKEAFAGGVASWNDVKLLGFAAEDIGGTTHDYSDIIVDEYIRFTSDAGEANACTFKVTDNSSGMGIFEVEISSQKGVPIDTEIYSVEFLPPFDPSQYATISYVDTQDDLKLNRAGGTLTGTLYSKTGGKSLSAFKINTVDSTQCWTIWCPGGPGAQTKYVGQNNTEHWFQLYDDTNKNPITTAKFAYESYSFLAKTNVTYSATDAHYFKSGVFFKNGNGDLKAQISNSNFDFYNLARFKQGFVVKGTGEDIGGDNTFSAYPDRVSYSGRMDNDTDIVNKAYVDSIAGAVPIGTVVMWFGTTAPTGWLICDGSSFNTTTYATLHAHLQTVPNYTSGKTPNFQGLYPGGAGSGHGNTLTSAGESKANIYHSQRTASPNGGNPTSIAEIPDGTTRTFNGTGGTNASSAGLSRVTISEGWDNVTRPPTLSVHFIIKAN